MIQICLVSRQPMPNVIPVFMYRPEKVYLLTTEDEKRCGNNLKQLFESKNILVEIENENIKPYNPDSVKTALTGIIRKENRESISINLTGGTKVMSIAAFEFSKQNGIPAFYCDTMDRLILHLLPKEIVEEFSVSLTIKEYLLSYGYEITEQKELAEIEKYYPLFEFIESNLLMKSFLKFNEEIKKKLAQSNPKFSVKSPDRNFIFHKQFGSYRLEFGNNERTSFTVKESDFKSGDWLEYYVYFKLRKLENAELISGVKILSDNQVQNEVDVIALKDEKLFLISCKSGRTDNQFDLFQLETIRSIASGTFGNGIFVSAHKSSEAFIKRAEELSLKVINIAKGDNIKL